MKFATDKKNSATVSIINESGAVVKTLNTRRFGNYEISYANWTTPSTAGSYNGYAVISSIDGKRIAVLPLMVTATQTVNVDPKTFWEYTGTRPRRIDNLDASISSRLATAGYTAPDNSGITAARKTLNNISGVSQQNKTAIVALGSPAQASVWTTQKAGYLDAAVSSRLTEANYAAPPTVQQIDTQLTSTHGSGAWTGSGGGGTAYVNSTSIAVAVDNRLTGSHGTGSWQTATSASVTILPFIAGPGPVQTVVQGKAVRIVRGDSMDISYSLGKNLTGCTVWFAAKASPGSTAYAMPLREITASVSDIANGSGLIPIAITDTALAVGKYTAEVEVRATGKNNTVMRFDIYIDQDIIREETP
jgi:hypothetical protein